MELVRAGVDEGYDFGRWNLDVHSLGVVLVWPKFTTVGILSRLGPAGAAVIELVGEYDLDLLADANRVGLIFEGAEGRESTNVLPVYAEDFTIDRRARTVSVMFSDPLEPIAEFVLPQPLPISVCAKSFFRRVWSGSLTRLDTRGGEIVFTRGGDTLCPGMVVAIDASCAWFGTLRLSAQVTGISSVRDRTIATFRLVTAESVRSAAVVLAGTVDGFGYSELASVRVPASRMARYLTLATVSDADEFREALEVRLAGNRDFGRLEFVNDPFELADDLDTHSIIVLCRLGDKPVGTARLVVNAGNRQLSETHGASEEGLPEKVWAGGFVEVSRLAIHPDFRGSGVIVMLFREIGRIALNLSCRYLILDSIAKLVPAYEKVGARQLPGLTKTHPYSAEVVYMMSIDIEDSLTRLDTRVAGWLYVFGPVLVHFLSSAPARAMPRAIASGSLPYLVKRTASIVQQRITSIAK